MASAPESSTPRRNVSRRDALALASVVAVSILAACGKTPPPTPTVTRPPLTITLVNGTIGNGGLETRTRDQLLRLLGQHDLTRWQFTDHVQIQHGAPGDYSHPILTLNTANLMDDHALLANYIHEQCHWYVASRPPGQEAVQGEMLRRYSNVPIAPPEGTGSEQSNYTHLVVCPLEFAGMIAVVGETEARRVIAAHPGYTAIYQIVLRDWSMIHTLFAQHAYGP